MITRYFFRSLGPALAISGLGLALTYASTLAEPDPLKSSAALEHGRASTPSKTLPTICTAATPSNGSDKIKVIIPQQLAGNDSATGSINELTTRVGNNRDPYFAKMEEISAFSGLFLSGQTDRSLPEGNTRSVYALEWELFNQGWNESRKLLAKTKLEHQVQYYQLLRDMEEKQLNESLFRLQQVRNKVLAFAHDKEVTALKSLLDRRKQELASRYVTREDVADIEFKVERATLKRAYYQSTDQLALSSEVYALINQVESLVLRPHKDLLERAVAHSYEHKLQELFADRSDYFPTWSDNLSLRFYVEKTRDFERDDQTVAGVRIRIPIGTNRGRDELVRLGRNSYLDQQQAVEARLTQKIAALTDRLRLKQSELELLQKEYQLLLTKTELACQQVKFPVSNIDATPARRIDELTIDRLAKEGDILRERLDIFEAMTELSALVKPEKPTDLYSLR